MEWYDKSCIRMVEPGGRRMVIYKSSIKYMYKAE
jgi:hypothetical protein